MPSESQVGSERDGGRLLVIDGSAARRGSLRSVLAAEGHHIAEAADATGGLAIARRDRPDLILIDLELACRGGPSWVSKLVDEPDTGRSSVILMAGPADRPGRVACGFDLGAVDVVAAEADPSELLARVRAALRARAERIRLTRCARIDPLTGLGNRLALEERLRDDWAICRRRGRPLALWIADLDHFKKVNDRFGHGAGDEVLRRVAASLRATARAGDFPARFGGEEFVIVGPDCPAAGALVMARRLRAAIARPMVADRLRGGAAGLRVTASLGVAVAEGRHPSRPLELLRRADQALYAAKAQGRDAVCYWDPEHERPVADTEAGLLRRLPGSAPLRAIGRMAAQWARPLWPTVDGDPIRPATPPLA